jgi:predicted PurR-regulated permease PerM
MLATVFLIPGGLLVLVAVALVIVLARTSRGQRLLVGVKRRVPPRVRTRVKRVLALVRGENIFLPQPPPVGHA